MSRGHDRSKKNASGGASGSEMDRVVQDLTVVAGWGEGGGHPVPAGQDEPSTPPAAGPGRSAVGCSTWTGGVRRAPLRVADGDGMDRAPYGAAAPGQTPELHAQVAREENGKWTRKSLGKGGKFIMVICLE